MNLGTRHQLQECRTWNTLKVSPNISHYSRKDNPNRCYLSPSLSLSKMYHLYEEITHSHTQTVCIHTTCIHLTYMHSHKHTYPNTLHTHVHTCIHTFTYTQTPHTHSCTHTHTLFSTMGSSHSMWMYTPLSLHTHVDTRVTLARLVIPWTFRLVQKVTHQQSSNCSLIYSCPNAKLNEPITNSKKMQLWVGHHLQWTQSPLISNNPCPHQNSRQVSCSTRDNYGLTTLGFTTVPKIKALCSCGQNLLHWEDPMK